jgi:hypothetical protein
MTNPPTAAIAAPAAGQTVSGTVTLTASASASAGIASVQFVVDGSNVGPPITAAPYSFSWNSAGVANGTHSVSAVASDTQGNKVSAAAVSIIVGNSAAPATTVTPTDYWSFDTAEMNGSIALDPVGGNNGVVANATPVPGESGQALAFNGVNSSVTVNDIDNTLLNASLTLAAWIRTTNSTRNETVISKYDTSGSEAGYLWRTMASGTMGLRLGSDVLSGNREFADTTTINDGLWHHVVAVITMGQTIQFYVDGVLSSTAQAPTQPGWSGVPFEMGSMAFTYYAYPFTGTIDEVKFFKRALSSSDVAAVYAGM